MYNTWDLSVEDKKKPDVIWKKFVKQLEPKTNFRLERYHLQKLKQEESESTDEYMIRCKLQAKNCKFRDNTNIEKHLIEQLIIRTRHRKFKEKLLGKDGDLKLDDALNIAHTCEATIVHTEQLLEEKTVSAISRKPPPKKTGPVTEKFCKRCGLTHSKFLSESCPAWGSTCHVCGKANHWGKMCNTTENRKSGDKEGQKAGSRVKPKTKFVPCKHKSVSAMPNEECG